MHGITHGIEMEKNGEIPEPYEWVRRKCGGDLTTVDGIEPGPQKRGRIDSLHKMYKVAKKKCEDKSLENSAIANEDGAPTKAHRDHGSAGSRNRPMHVEEEDDEDDERLAKAKKIEKMTEHCDSPNVCSRPFLENPDFRVMIVPKTLCHRSRTILHQDFLGRLL